MPVLSAQWMMGYHFHVGGISALALEGHNYYLRLGRGANVYLCGDVLNWLFKLRVDAQFILRRRRLFDSVMIGIDDQDLDPSADKAPSPWNWPLRRSTPERALLEAINELPEHESFHTVDLVFQGVASLWPGRLTTLLRARKSVKESGCSSCSPIGTRSDGLITSTEPRSFSDEGPAASWKADAVSPPTSWSFRTNLPLVCSMRLTMARNRNAAQVSLLVRAIPAAADLQAVRWKLGNPDKLRHQNPDKFATQREALSAAIAKAQPDRGTEARCHAD